MGQRHRKLRHGKLCLDLVGLLFLVLLKRSLQPALQFLAPGTPVLWAEKVEVALSEGG